MRSQYPGLLALSNVILLVSSTILMYLGIALVQFYLLDRLDFISDYFSVVPRIMIFAGVATFVVALYGCFVAANSNRCHLILYSILMIGLFLTQLAGIFAAMELRGVINRSEFQSVDVLSDLSDYKANPSTRARWDRLHREFGCCGGLNFNDGYKIWRNADIGLEDNSVPDSCCLRPAQNCGTNKFREADVTMDLYIHTHGCITVMEPKLKDQVVPVLLGYSGVGTFLALVQLLSVVFACSYSSAISRYQKQRDTSDNRSYRGGNNGHAASASAVSAPNTPRFDHIRAYGRDNISTVFNDEQLYDDGDYKHHNSKIYRSSSVRAESPTSQLQEREV